MKPWQHILLGIILGLFVTGVVFFIITPQKGEPITLYPAPTPSPILIHVDGAVISPGVYEVPVGSRVQDVVFAAGGLAAEADTSQVNLAMKVVDGQKISVPYISSTLNSESADDSKKVENLPSEGFVNLNTATLAQLDSLPGIGKAKAQAIIDYRAENGDFTEIEDILEVPGIGDGIFNQIKTLITVK